jgi:hypothetical protein
LFVIVPAMFLVVTKLSTSTFNIVSRFVQSEETNQTMHDMRQSTNQLWKMQLNQ